MSTGQASRACVLNSALLVRGVWSVTTAFRQFQILEFRRACARSSKRADGLINRIARDQRRDPERLNSQFRHKSVSPGSTFSLRNVVRTRVSISDSASYCGASFDPFDAIEFLIADFLRDVRKIKRGASRRIGADVGPVDQIIRNLHDVCAIWHG